MIPAAAMAQDRPRYTENEIVRHDRVDLKVADFDSKGLILDIGGGGEAVISQMKGQQVVAIDLMARELQEAPGNPLLKIVMDATDMKFMDTAFPVATCFFTLMFVPMEKHLKVLQETYRVLQPGGRLLVWDVEVPVRPAAEKKVVVYYFNFLLPGKTVKTGYGTPYREVARTMPYFEGLAKEAGFQVGEKRVEGRTFFIELKKG